MADINTPANEALYAAWLAADQAWHKAVVAAFPGEDAGLVRYQDKGKGEAGSALRELYETFVKTGSAWHEAKDADLTVLYF